MTKSQQFLAAVTLVIVGYSLGMKSPSPEGLRARPKNPIGPGRRGPASLSAPRIASPEHIDASVKNETKTREAPDMPFHELIAKCKDAEMDWRNKYLWPRLSLQFEPERGLE